GVRLLTSFHIINKGVEASPFPVNMGDVFREEAHEKERVVADVFSDFTLVNKRTPSEQWIGGNQHFTYIFKPLAFRIADAIHVLNMAEINEQARNVVGNPAIFNCAVPRSRFSISSVKRYRRG
ncbi:MAG: hypothetical protein JO182_12350, partial [Acidobacteriaceae bacterium]|nr:hypothetical protein [Acidobacteriaceae bacterium]